MDTLDTKNEQNEPDIFVYEKCDYKCFKNSKYDRHLATDKHKWIHFGYILDTFWIQKWIPARKTSHRINRHKL